MNSLTPHRRLANPTVLDTIGYMVQFAKQGAKDLDIRRLVEKICAKLEPGDYSSEILACYYFVDANIRYMRDIDNVEFLKWPKQVLQTRAGDCDDIATLLAAMLISCGNKVRFCIVDIDRSGPINFSHVFCQVFVPTEGRWTTVDPVAGKENIDMHNRVRSAKTFMVR